MVPGTKFPHRVLVGLLYYGNSSVLTGDLVRGGTSLSKVGRSQFSLLCSSSVEYCTDV